MTTQHTFATAATENGKLPLKIILTTAEDDNRSVYISGNFNQWKTQDENYKMEKISEGKYQFTFPDDFYFEGEMLYKFTKGDWSAVEISEDQTRTENRVNKKSNGIIEEFVAKWRKHWLPFKNNFIPKIQLISEEFEIPQLNKTRKIWALLPFDYDETDEHYPVIYLQDAQNLFNEDSPFGNWEIDKKLAVMAEYNIGKIIVIAIEHAESERATEYNVGNTKLGLGEGKKYIRFIADTLKPFVDENFRTKPERDFTGIGGSSLGGLVSIYSGLMYPEVYGKLMIFSPSLWVIHKLDIFNVPFFEPEKTKIYLYAGGEESKSMVSLVKKFKKALLSNKLTAEKMQIQLSINEKGKHNEAYWSDEFPQAIEWLFFRND